jgi:hypothetical protein
MEDAGMFYGTFGQFYGHLVYFVAIWYILWLLAIFLPVLVCCTKKIWQPCTPLLFVAAK